MAFTSVVPFNAIEVHILPGAGSDFLADNFVVTTAPTAIPEPSGLLLCGIGLGLTAAVLSPG